MSRQESFTFGPMLSVTAGFFNRTLTAGYSTAYNVNTAAGIGVQAQVLNMRCSLAYRFAKRHNVTASVIWQHRNIKDRDPKHLTTGTLNYSFSF
jgi:long-subunit fatty acid transport protein